MGAFFYGVSLQWKLDIRSKTLLVTCYIVPIVFFAIMGGIFTSVMPESRNTLIQSMTVFGVTMGALIGLPPFSCGNLWKRYKKDLQSERGSPVAGVCFNKPLSIYPSVLYEPSSVYRRTNGF